MTNQEQLFAAIASEQDCILVWPYEKAPESLRELEEDPSDIDWLVLVPWSVPDEEYIRWLDSIDSCKSPKQHKLSDGSRVYIGGH